MCPFPVVIVDPLPGLDVFRTEDADPADFGVAYLAESPTAERGIRLMMSFQRLTRRRRLCANLRVLGIRALFNSVLKASSCGSQP